MSDRFSAGWLDYWRGICGMHGWWHWLGWVAAALAGSVLWAILKLMWKVIR